MALTIKKVDVWAGELRDVPGGLADVLGDIAQAPGNLEFLIASKPGLVLQTGIDGQFLPDPRLAESGIPVMFINPRKDRERYREALHIMNLAARDDLKAVELERIPDMYVIKIAINRARYLDFPAGILNQGLTLV